MAAVHPGALATGALQKEERRRRIHIVQNNNKYLETSRNIDSMSGT
jgi:hypothetical protein